MRVDHSPAAAVAQAVVAVPRGWDSDADADAILGAAAVRRFDALTADLADVVALVTGDHRVTALTMERIPRLRVISVDGTGVWDQVDVAAATARGIAVCNVRDYAADAVAEFTLGAMISLARHIPAAAASARAGCWDPDDFMGTELRGRILGLVGFGSIGARVAELARAFGMAVLCATPRPQTDRAPDVRFVDLDELLESCDVLSLHARLDETTRGMIGAEELARLRPGALLVNTARGALVDSDALVHALRVGRLAGAAIDVTDPEPMPQDAPLRSLPSVLITPHIAAATVQARRAAVAGCLRNVAAFLDGRPTSVVNPEVLR
jgi:phosphoglycerate dehydrogenase-like enzyme